MANLLGEFLKRLCGPKCQGLKVQQGETLGWQPKVMLTHTTQLLLSCAPQPGFVQALRDAVSNPAPNPTPNPTPNLTLNPSPTPTPTPTPP